MRAMGPPTAYTMRAHTYDDDDDDAFTRLYFYTLGINVMHVLRMMESYIST